MTHEELLNIIERIEWEQQEKIRSLALEHQSLDNPDANYIQGYMAGLRAVRDQIVAWSLRQPEGVLPREAVAQLLRHPHPRSYAYRAEPESWLIREVSGGLLLKTLSQRAQLSAAQGKTPAVVFDLDGTLFDVSARTLGILHEWLESDDAHSAAPDLLQKLRNLDFRHIGYSLAQAFENAGLNLIDEQVVKVFLKVERYWQKRFFDGQALLQYDRVTPGAHDFVWSCHRAGIRVVYLTGRSGISSAMRRGTREQLEKHGFPLEDVEVLLKENLYWEDHVFKGRMFAELCQRYEVIGNFENEYVNILEMGRQLQQPSAQGCLHVVMDSQHSGRNVEHLPGTVYRISNFL